jgi:hypothetical protein
MAGLVSTARASSTNKKADYLQFSTQDVYFRAAKMADVIEHRLHSIGVSCTGHRSDQADQEIWVENCQRRSPYDFVSSDISSTTRFRLLASLTTSSRLLSRSFGQPPAILLNLSSMVELRDGKKSTEVPSTP